MPHTDSKWITISLTVERNGFPLTGSELKEICEHIAVINFFVNNHTKYEQWANLYPRLAGNFDKLLKYSLAKNPQYNKISVMLNEQSNPLLRVVK